MSDPNNAHPWFRRRALGIGGTPITWEGWLATMLLVLSILATVGLADPRDASGPNSVIFLDHVKAMLGLTHVRLGFAQVLAVMAVEITAFILLVRSKAGDSRVR